MGGEEATDGSWEMMVREEEETGGSVTNAVTSEVSGFWSVHFLKI